MGSRRVPGHVLACLTWLLINACSTPPENYALLRERAITAQREVPVDFQQIERGRPNAVLDRLNHYLLSLPSKILLWNWHVMNHEFPEEQELALRHYLTLNRMHSVKVRHNQYAPIDEFRRLRENSEVGAGYRYTLGLFNLLRYAIFPERVFGGLPIIGVGDNFNPFSNTINVYSSELAILLHEAGHAKDYLSHERRGTTFAALRLVPFVDLFQEAKASTDAIRYLYCIRDRKGEFRAYKTLIPAYSTYVAGYVPGGLVMTLPVVAAGHVSGRLQARARAHSLEHPERDAGGYYREAYLPDFCVPISDPSEVLEATENVAGPAPASLVGPRALLPDDEPHQKQDH